MKPTLIFIALCAASITASAQSDAQTRPAWLPNTIGLHIASRHAATESNTPGALRWNNANNGAFLGWELPSSQSAGIQLNHQLIAGAFKNSLYQPSHYIGLDTTSQPLHTRAGSFALALSATLTSGYDRITSEYTGGAVPAGQSIKVRCTSATGCRQVLTKPVYLLAIAPGVDFSPAFAPKTTLRLSYLHDAGLGSKAVHLTARWSF